MGEIHQFKTEKDMDRETVLEVLEELTKIAKEGKLDALGVACVLSNGHISAAFSETVEGARILGAATLLQSRILKAMDDETDDE
jgi:hypothetical protein